MKTLLVSLAAAIALVVGYWKTQHPDATLADLQTHADSGITRLKGGWDAIRTGGDTGVTTLGADQTTLIDSQTALSSRLDALEANMATGLQPAPSGADQADSEKALVMQGRLTDAERRLDAADSQMDSVKQSVDTVTTSNQSVVAKLDAINGRIDLLTRRIDEQSSVDDIAQMRTELSALTSSGEQTREQMAELKNELSSDITSVDERATALSSRFNTLSIEASAGSDATAATINAQVDQRIALLEEKLGTTNSDARRLVALSDQLDATRKKVAVLEEQSEKDKTNNAKLQNSIAELKTANESISIDTVQAEIQAQLDGLKEQLEAPAASTDINEFNTELSMTRQQLSALELRVSGLPATSSAADDAQQLQSQLQAQIAALETRLASNPQTDPAIATTLSEVQQQVTQLASKSYVTQEELREQQTAKQVQYKIYFNRNSTAITAEAAKVLNSFIAQEKNRTTGVSIYGFTDRRGTAEYNQELALRRATNVRSYLIQNGFDFTKINSLNGLGEDAAAISSEDGAEDAKERSVVLFAAQP
ncbi:MAG: OmpA family protein [Granulosicoccaceae bacterium]